VVRYFLGGQELPSGGKVGFSGAIEYSRSEFFNLLLEEVGIFTSCQSDYLEFSGEGTNYLQGLLSDGAC